MCELGELTTTSHKLYGKEEDTYDSGVAFFEPTAPREKFKSCRFMELLLDFSTGMSDRNAARRLNRVRLMPEGISPTTLRNTVEREGKGIQHHMDGKCELALLQNGFAFDGEALSCSPEFKPDESKHIKLDEIMGAAGRLNLKTAVTAVDYESPEHSVNISVDDVCVKRQSGIRPKPDGSIQPKRVNNTVIHIQKGDGKYILNASSLYGTLKLLAGFLLNCGLLGYQLVFFTDGARDIHGAIPKVFCFANYKVILDWYHLKKKFQEQLSMALRGSKIRNEFLDELLPCLWYGNIDGAIHKLQNIEKKKIKDPTYIIKLIEYLERVRYCVPCYALRKELGLRNSSNLGEKANDLVVANRQKHNGMSWSKEGSVAFASVSSASFNNEINTWVHSHTIEWSFNHGTAA